MQHQPAYPAALINVGMAEENSMCHLLKTPDLEVLPLLASTHSCLRSTDL